MKRDVVMKRLTFSAAGPHSIRSSVPTEVDMPNRDLIRASEIADWCFCRRSWYLCARGVGPSLVQIEKRHAGVYYHQQHARNVDQARGVMNGAIRALIVAVVLAAAYWFWAYAR
jgi:hypothetical protein